MDEYIDIITSTGKPTNKIALKSEAHKNGWYHNTIHLWLYTTDGRVLLQQRSHKKEINPLLWDVSVAGHVDTSETYIETVLRETKEELGLTLSPNDVIKIGVKKHEKSYHYDRIIDNEFHHIYISELKVDINKLTPQPDEVEALKLVSLEAFSDLLNHSKTNHHFIASNISYYKFILQHIKAHLSI